MPFPLYGAHPHLVWNTLWGCFQLEFQAQSEKKLFLPIVQRYLGIFSCSLLSNPPFSLSWKQGRGLSVNSPMTHLPALLIFKILFIPKKVCYFFVSFFWAGRLFSCHFLYHLYLKIFSKMIFSAFQVLFLDIERKNYRIFKTKKKNKTNSASLSLACLLKLKINLRIFLLKLIWGVCFWKRKAKL